MHQGQAVSVVVDGVLESGTNDAGRALTGDGLDADAAGVRESNLVDAHFILQEGDELGHAFASGFPFDAGIDVLTVLTEDDHVNVFGGSDG